MDPANIGSVPELAGPCLALALTLAAALLSQRSKFKGSSARLWLINTHAPPQFIGRFSQQKGFAAWPQCESGSSPSLLDLALAAVASCSSSTSTTTCSSSLANSVAVSWQTDLETDPRCCCAETICRQRITSIDRGNLVAPVEASFSFPFRHPQAHCVHYRTPVRSIAEKFITVQRQQLSTALRFYAR